MFGSGTSVSKAESDPSKSEAIDSSPSPDADDGGGGSSPPTGSGFDARSIPEEAVVGELPISDKRNSNGNLPSSAGVPVAEKKRRSSGVSSKASSLFAQAKNSLNFGSSSKNNGDGKASDSNQTPFQKLGKQDPALAVPQGQHNNSAGESIPGPRSTFRVGVWEDRNKKCRRTMEDTHAFLYNFLPTPAPVVDGAASSKDAKPTQSDDDVNASQSALDMIETDNGYFAIFDGHAGSFAADWCGKKLHIILEDVIRKHPNTPIPELLDMTFTSVDAQLEKLPSKSSGCTAAIAVLRWEDRVPNDRSATGSQSIAPAAAKVAASSKNMAADSSSDVTKGDAADAPTPTTAVTTTTANEAVAKLRSSATRHRVLYTANVGDARIILCRNGKALRLSYDHKGSDENEGKRIANAGGLIVNNRVNGVLAVTRALGDAYMKELVTGHPYTTETVIVPDTDEFIIIACDGLWDVCSDQEAVDLVRGVEDPFAASKLLVDHALNRFSTDNLSCMVVRLDRAALVEQQNNREHAIGVEGDTTSTQLQQTESEKIVGEAKRRISGGADATPATTIVPTAAADAASSSSSDPHEDDGYKPSLDGVGEEPAEDSHQEAK
jgi:protein phosphatase PTC1